eukprot:549749_1
MMSIILCSKKMQIPLLVRSTLWFPSPPIHPCIIIIHNHITITVQSQPPMNNNYAQQSVPVQQQYAQGQPQQQRQQYPNRFVPSHAFQPPPKPMQIMVTSPKHTQIMHPSQSVLSDRTSPGTEYTE